MKQPHNFCVQIKTLASLPFHVEKKDGVCEEDWWICRQSYEVEKGSAHCWQGGGKHYSSAPSTPVAKRKALTGQPDTLTPHTTVTRHTDPHTPAQPGSQAKSAHPWSGTFHMLLLPLSAYLMRANVGWGSKLLGSSLIQLRKPSLWSDPSSEARNPMSQAQSQRALAWSLRGARRTGDKARVDGHWPAWPPHVLLGVGHLPPACWDCFLACVTRL